MNFCARATHGLRRPSPGLMARLGVPLGGRVRKSRAVEDQSSDFKTTFPQLSYLLWEVANEPTGALRYGEASSSFF